MQLRAKCVRELASSEDGERLLVGRVRPRELVRVDGWERRLAPSTKLDFALYRRWITWREYAGLYVAEMWGQAELLREIGERARTRPLTFVCTCVDAERCHRGLLARMVAQLFVAGRRAPRELPVAPRARARVHAMA
jgi:uncharacterized protein YeaO (DUF488 family)